MGWVTQEAAASEGGTELNMVPATTVLMPQSLSFTGGCISQNRSCSVPPIPHHWHPPLQPLCLASQRGERMPCFVSCMASYAGLQQGQSQQPAQNREGNLHRKCAARRGQTVFGLMRRGLCDGGPKITAGVLISA